jgi:hypothetical protein
MEDVGIFLAHLVFLGPLGIFFGHLVHFWVIWYIFTRFGMLYQEKSGNPAVDELCKKMTHARRPQEEPPI